MNTYVSDDKFAHFSIFAGPDLKSIRTAAGRRDGFRLIGHPITRTWCSGVRDFQRVLDWTNSGGEAKP